MRITIACIAMMVLVLGCGDSKKDDDSLKLNVPADPADRVALTPPPPPPPPPPSRHKSHDHAKPSVEGAKPDGLLSGSPPPPPSAKSSVVPQRALEQLRTEGEVQIAPDDADRKAMRDSQVAQVVATIKLCLDERGQPTEVKVIKPSGYPGYDAKLQSTIKDTWRYKPFLVDGTAKPVCTAVTFIFKER